MSSKHSFDRLASSGLLVNLLKMVESNDPVSGDIVSNISSVVPTKILVTFREFEVKDKVVVETIKGLTGGSIEILPTDKVVIDGSEYSLSKIKQVDYKGLRCGYLLEAYK